MEVGEYINEVMYRLKYLQELQGEYFDEGALVAFRGESKDYENTKLMPSIFRNPEMVEKEAHIFELIRDYDIISDGKNEYMDKAITAQHYIAISRMLDITFSVLTAIYFACKSKDNKEEDGIIYIFRFPEHYSPHSTYLEEFYRRLIKNEEDILYPKNFKVITHSFSNERIMAQMGGFILFPGKEYMPISDIYYEKVIIAAKDKNKLLEDINILFGIEEATLFPEKDKRAELVKKKLEKESYIGRKLTIENEIETFFNRIEFELAIKKKKHKYSDGKKEILRWLRKEKSDILEYIEGYEKNKTGEEKIKEQVDLKKQVDENFKYLERIW